MRLPNTAARTTVISGIPVARDAAMVRLGTDIAFTPVLRLHLGYDGLVSNRSWDHAVTARLEWVF